MGCFLYLISYVLSCSTFPCQWGGFKGRQLCLCGALHTNDTHKNMVPLWPRGLKGSLYWYNCDHKAKPYVAHTLLCYQRLVLHIVSCLCQLKVEFWGLLMSNRSWSCSSCPLCKPPQLFFSGLYSKVVWIILKGTRDLSVQYCFWKALFYLISKPIFKIHVTLIRFSLSVGSWP